MKGSTTRWLDKAIERFKSCAFNLKDDRCSLKCYPVLDCHDCKEYKKKEK